jgi:deoxyribose-phosphate aldolase
MKGTGMSDLSKMTKEQLARYMDYSILPKETVEREIRQGCALARKYRFAAFYTSSAYWTPIVREELKGFDDIEIGIGIAFPFGIQPACVKALETEDAVRKGCTAVDLVMNIGALKDRNYAAVREELKAFVAAAGGAVTKCILEVCYLSNEDIAAGSKLIAEAGIHYAKTSTGQFEGPGMEQFLVMKRTLAGTGIKLKVSGVKFPRPQNAIAFIKAGAERIGTRAAPEMVDALDTMREAGLL